MALGSFRKQTELNPELEALRNKGLTQNVSETNDWILQMISKTSRIHASFLFEDRKTLQNLCLFISETQNKITDAGWESFGYHLGLNPSILKVINYNNFNKEDPCYNVLLAFVQQENASIGKIISALNSMGRIDVLSRIQYLINDLADIILQYNASNDSSCSVEETSDYASLTSSEEDNNSNNIQNTNVDSTCNALIRPKVIPPAPFIFQNIQVSPEITAQQIQQNLSVVFNSATNLKKEECKNNKYLEVKIANLNNIHDNHDVKLITETLQCQKITNYESKSFTDSKSQKYGIKILLTFAEDGEKYAAEVSRVFRKKRDNFPRIGVLVLSEHSTKVNKDPQQFISGAFFQVDYVCPILTAGYFNLISRKQKASQVSSTHIDALYVPYIFRLMNSYFISNDCLNDKVRCIIPEAEFSSIPFKSLWTNPIFGAWINMSEVENLALRLLKK